MKEFIRLTRIDFDNMENRDAVYKTQLGNFEGVPGGLTAHGKVSDYIQKLEPIKMYLGWDGCVYPQFVLNTEYLD